MLCAPALLYLVVAIITIVLEVQKKFPFTVVLGKSLFSLIWVYLLNFLCGYGFTSISWFLVLLPVLVFVIIFIFLDKAAKRLALSREHHRSS